MKFTDALLPITVVAIIALGAYLLLSDKMIATDASIEQENAAVANPSARTQNNDDAMMMDDEPSSDEEPVETDSSVNQARDEEVSESATDNVTAGLDYENGTYTADVTYRLPNGGSHDMNVSLTIADDAVTDVVVVFDGDTSGGSTDNQERFVNAMKPLVVGTQLDSISLSRTGGSSLTTGGFNDALAEIKDQARS